MIYKINAREMSVLSVVSLHHFLCIIQTIMKDNALIVRVSRLAIFTGQWDGVFYTNKRFFIIFTSTVSAACLGAPLQARKDRKNLIDNYAGGKVPACPSPPSSNLCNIFIIMASSS